jgi:hypothetical protein
MRSSNAIAAGTMSPEGCAGLITILTGALPLMRRAREARMLMTSSDQELASLGMKRGEILDNAFGIYRGL